MTEMIQRVALIGAGKVARQLARWIRSSGVEIVQIYNRSLPAAETLAAEVGSTAINKVEELNADVQLVIISVNDDAISDLADAMPETNAVVVHTSGTRPMDDLKKHEKRGVFYPLQTFTDQHDVNFRQVPICIEGVDESVTHLLKSCCVSWGALCYELNSSQRAMLHVAAVVANNFTNHLWGRSFDLLKEHEIEPDILFPLMMQTVEKAIHAHPHSIQTGPAARGDNQTIERHLDTLKSDANFRELYRLLTSSIQENQQNGKL